MPKNNLKINNIEDIVSFLEYLQSETSILDIELVVKLINLKSYLKTNKNEELIYDNLGIDKKSLFTQINKRIKLFFESCQDKIYSNHSLITQEAIWKEISNNSYYLEKISKSKLSKSLEKNNINIKVLLKFKKLVKCFENEIFNFLVNNNDKLIELLVKKYEIKNYHKIQIYLPKRFNIEYKDNIKFLNEQFIIYLNNIDETDVNKYGYLKFVISPVNIPLNMDIKYLAKRKAEILEEKIEWNFFKIPQVSIKFENIDEDFIYDKDGDFIYNLSLVEDHADFKTRFIYNLRTQYGFFIEGMMNIGSRLHVPISDSLFLKGKGEYDIDLSITPFVYHLRTLLKYNEILKMNDSSLEQLLLDFYNYYLLSEYKLQSFEMELDFGISNYKTKIKDLLTEFDLTIQKLDFFLKNKYLDFKYVHFDDQPKKFENIRSLFDMKNVYLNDEADYSLFYELNFSNYNINLSGEYSDLYLALTEHQILYENLLDNEKERIDFLIKKDVLIVKNGLLNFSNYRKSRLYRRLFEYGEICFPNLDELNKEIIINEINKGKLKTDSKLLSKSERNLLSYILDDKTYTNGLKLRNKYIHKSTSRYKASEIEHKVNYYIILILFILITLKFNDEMSWI